MNSSLSSPPECDKPAVAGAQGGGKRAAGLYTIIALKLAKGVLLLLVGLGVASLAGRDLQAVFDSLLRWVDLDPEHHFFAALGAKLQTITPGNIRWVASGTLLYSALLFVESIGLMFRTFWAAWLAIGETAFFIPLEVFELLRNYSVTVTVILVANTAIVWYLVRNRERLFHHHHPRHHHLHPQHPALPHSGSDVEPAP
jgi:uncharacterized membrane protein (DUF2068 family)